MLQFLTFSCRVVTKGHKANLQLKVSGLLNVYNVLVPAGVKMCQKGAKIRIKNQSQNLLKIWSFWTGFSFSDVIITTKFFWHGHCMKSYVFFKDSFSRCEQIDLTVKKNIAFYAVGFLITTLQLHQVVFQSFVTPARCDNLGRCTSQFISIVRDGIYIMYLLYIITTSFLLQIFICNICLYSTFLFIFLMTYFWKRVPFLHVVNNESVT